MFCKVIDVDVKTSESDFHLENMAKKKVLFSPCP